MSLITTGLSGLLAAQRGLDVTANNVANSNTDGYVRRRVLLTEANSPTAGVSANIGNGVNVAGVQRLYDEFIGAQLQSATSSQQGAQTLSDLATRLDNLLGNPDQSISSGIQGFFNQVTTLSQDATSSTNRQQLLVQANALSDRFQQLNSQLTSLGNEVNLRLQDSVTQINNIADSIAKLNSVLGQGGASNSNDLLDQRSLLLQQLSQQVNATVVTQADGSVNVLIGNGQPLVLGVQATKVALVADQFDPTRQQLAVVNGDTSQVVSRQISGGTLGGLLAFRDEALDPASRSLGLVAQGLTSAFNAQHRLGVDANGSFGGDFFAPIAPVVLTSNLNKGTGSISAAITDSTALQARDYNLRYNGSAWQVTDAATGAAVTASGAGTAASPLVVEGISLTVSGTPSSGDNFLVQAAAGAAGRVGVVVTDPLAIAVAAPVSASAAQQNASGAIISAPGSLNTSNPGLLTPVRIVFDDPTTYRIRSTSGTDLSGPLAYSSGGNISFNGWTVKISGAPAAGDTFNVTPNGSGSGDNGNALALAQLSGQRTLQGGTASINDVASQMLDTVGATAQRASQNLTVQTALQQQVQQDSNNASGVNLNEEAANMLKYQQAYQAASKIIAMANDLFQTLLNVVH